MNIRKKINIFLDELGWATLFTFTGLSDAKEHIALSFADENVVETRFVRLHSECLTGDVFKSCRCDCGKQLQEALHVLKQKKGILIYLRQEGRGIGLYNKIDAYAVQDEGYDTFEANRKLHFPSDMRDYTVAAETLSALGIRRIHLLTNNPDKVKQLKKNNIEVISTLPTATHLHAENYDYLLAKKQKARHSLKIGDEHDRP